MALGKRSNLVPSPHGTLAWLAVVRAYNLCDSVMAVRLGALGLNVGEHEVLANLATTPGITQQELAIRCFVAKSGVSMLVTRMADQGLVAREGDATDARVKRLFLSASGEALAKKTLRIQAEVVGAMASAVSDGELDQVADVMQRVSLQLESLRQQPLVGSTSKPKPLISPRFGKASSRR